MSPHQIVAVAVRLIAIWLVALVAIDIPYYFLATPAPGEDISISVYLGEGALFVLVAIGLWRFPLTVASRLLSSDVEKSESPAKPDMWLAMGCSLMGLWLLVTMIPSLVHDLVWLIPPLAGDYSDEALRVLFGLHLPKVIIGVWLVLGAKGFRRLFWWARYAGRNTTPQENPELPRD